MSLAVDPHLKGTFHNHDQFVDLMGMERRAGARLGGVQAERTGNAVLLEGNVPLSIAGPPGDFRDAVVVDYRHDISTVNRVFRV
jgi:hypothetical protein